MGAIRFLSEQRWAVMVSLVAGSVMGTLIWTTCCKGWSSLIWIIAFTVVLWLALWLGNRVVAGWLDRYLSWQQQPARRFAFGLAAMLVYTIAMVSVIQVAFGWMGFVVGEQLTQTYVSAVTLTLLISLFITARKFLLYWRESAVRTERMQRELWQARFDSLRHQVNPHFLFNSLNVLTNLVHEHPEQAVKFIRQLSEVYRYVLDTRMRTLVPVADELAFVEAYFFLQQLRFGSKLLLERVGEVPPCFLPPLALQVLFENAIKHNIVSHARPLRIRLILTAEHIAVENNLQRRPIPEHESSGLGLQNIRERFRYFTDAEIRVEEELETFRVTLPLITHVE